MRIFDAAVKPGTGWRTTGATHGNPGEGVKGAESTGAAAPGAIY